jgi:nitrite reductase (NO-forming)
MTLFGILCSFNHIALAEITELARVTQELVNPPYLPEHSQIAEGPSKIVQIEMTIEEKEIEVEPGVFIHALTFNGSVPGPLIVVHQDDYVELTLVNPSSNSMMHNIDFHAATGAMGGGDLTMVSPGEEVVIRFKATKAGVFVYHCAPGGPMVPWHVVHGMNGAIMVLPREGLVDNKGRRIEYTKAFYIGEQDFYIPKDDKGKYKRFNTPIEGYVEELEVMSTLKPSHVVFNGKVGALTGPGALKANVGDTVLFIHAQANRQSYPHLIGGHGDYVWERGNFSDSPQTNLESWVIGAGSAGASVYTFRQPGFYAYLNHNLIEAFLLGAAAHIIVDGEWDSDLMTQILKPSTINN